jgi:hypothetical protein
MSEYGQMKRPQKVRGKTVSPFVDTLPFYFRGWEGFLNYLASLRRQNIARTPLKAQIKNSDFEDKRAPYLSMDSND